MKNTWIVLVVLGGVLFATVEAQRSSGLEPEGFVVFVGAHRYEATAGEPVTIVTPRGEEVTIVVEPKQTLHYAGSGLSFEYPRQLELSTDEQEGVDLIYLRSRGTPLGIIQSYTVRTSPAEIRRKLVAGLIEQFSSSGARFAPGSGRMTQASIAGQRRGGQLLDYEINGVQMKTEVYAFRLRDRVVALVFQYAEGDSEPASLLFSVVTSSLR